MTNFEGGTSLSHFIKHKALISESGVICYPNSLDSACTIYLHKQSFLRNETSPKFLQHFFHFEDLPTTTS